MVRFRGYAKRRIKGAILDNLRDPDWDLRDLLRRHKELEASSVNCVTSF
jgi:DNA-directed RNA polymerase specialized sigma subunit